MTKRILLTGASGFTGRHFIDLASRLNYHCVALCHKPTDLSDFMVKQDIGNQTCTEHLSIVVADLTNKAQLQTAISDAKPDMVVHLAAISFVDHGDVADIYQTNLLGTINLLDCLIESGLPLQKVLIASSGNVYGNNEQLPIHEGLLPTPINDYGVSKYSMELAAHIRSDKLPIIISRPFNYVGVGQAEHFLIPKIVAAFRAKQTEIYLGNLDVARDFSDVRDIVWAYLKLLTCEVKTGTFNLCTGKATSLLTVIEQLNVLSGYQIEVKVNPQFVRVNEIKTLYGDQLRLVSAIGSYQQYTLQDTLKWMYQAPMA